MFSKTYRKSYTKHTGLRYLAALVRQYRKQGECYIRKAYRQAVVAKIGTRHVIFSWKPTGRQYKVQRAYFHYTDTCKAVASRDLWRISR